LVKRSFFALPLLAALLTFDVTTGAASGGSASLESARPAVDSTTALVELTGKPLAVSPSTAPVRGAKINLRSAAVRSQRAALVAVRNDFRRWLRVNAPAASITSEHDIAVHAVGVQLNGTPLARIAAAPMVTRAELQQVFTPVAHDDPDLELVNANEAWTAVGGEANAGAGVKVAIIDSGIDQTHPCFDDTGYPAQTQLGDLALTNNKVIVAKVFSNRIRQDELDPTAVNGHGTHVAGTVACNAHSDAVIDGVEIPYDPSGVAPRALLGNYNVFPGETGSARSEDILNALDAAYADGMDVANMSLGGARNDGGGAFLLTKAIDNYDRANLVVAVAAGNEGPGYFTVHYPGAARRALTAGASTVGHAIINVVEVAGVDYEAVVGDFAVLEDDLTADLAVVPAPSGQAAQFPHGLSTACDGAPPLPNLTGQIALLGRGTCDFTVKMRNAQNAGAVGVIMVNHTAGEAPFVMAHNGLEPRPTIPGYMVSLEDGAAIDDHNGEPATLEALGVYITRPEATNRMAGFSSWGPTHGDVLIKPDVVAPGADVVSSFPAATCEEPERSTVGCWTFLGGTSMATPHVAGAAAVVRGFHRDWSAAQVRSAVTNTAQQNLLRHPATNAVTNDAQIVGAGLLDVEAAVKAVAALDPVSHSFGALSSGGGVTRTSTITVTNIGAVSRTYTVSVADTNADGVTFTTSGGTFTLAPRASRSVTISAQSTKSAPTGHKQATLRVTSGGTEVAHAMLYTLIGVNQRAPGRHMTPPPFA
jgi:minor extracellular serine protease Vpr